MATDLKTTYKTGDPNPAAATNTTNKRVNEHDAILTGRLSETSIAAQIAESTRGALDKGALLVTPDRFSVDPTGTNSSQAGISAAMAYALANGFATVKLIGTMRCTNSFTIPPDLTLDWSEALYVRDFAGTGMTCSATIETIYSPTSVLKDQFFYVSGTQSMTSDALVFGSVPAAWAPGDMLRIVSDDIIPGENFNVGDTGHMRYGEYVHVKKIEGNTVFLTSKLLDPYATNIRVARVLKQTTHIKGLRATVSDNVWNNKLGGRTIRLTGLTKPVVEDMYVERELNYPLSLRATLGHVVNRMYVETLANDPENGYYGYAIHESSCQDGLIFKLDSFDQRHGWTDGVPLVPTNHPVLWDYGRVQNSKLAFSSVRATSQSAFDTHHGSREVQFIGCTSYAGPMKNNYALRGENHRVIDCIAIGGLNAVRVFTEDYSGDSRGHYVSNLRVRDVDRVVTVEIWTGANHPNFGQQDPEQSVTIDGVYGTGVGSLSYVQNGSCRITNYDIEMAPSVTQPVAFNTNGRVEHDGRLDARKVASYTYTTALMRNLGNGSQFYYSGEILLSDAIVTALSPKRFFLADNGDNFRFDILLNKFIANAPYAVPSAATMVDIKWRAQSATGGATNLRRSSHHVELQNADIASATSLLPLGNASHDAMTLTLVISDSTNRNLGALPSGQFDGQRLLIAARSIGAQSVTVRNGSTYGTVIGADVVLTAGQSLSLYSSGNAWYKVG